MPLIPDSFPEEEQSRADNQEEMATTPSSEQVAESVTEEGAQSASGVELPTGAAYETNGGPLGCCLGTVVGLLLTPLIITTISLILSNGAYLGPATLPIVLFGAVICGFLGWKIGKRIYREYELSPRQKKKLERLEQKYR